MYKFNLCNKRTDRTVVKKNVKMIKENRVEQIIIKQSHPKYKIINQQCFHSKKGKRE